eukprot:CAMPEP_0169464326 /NCGR_PEP_ID=MMETSP1042-20121227/20605_1 /TAXON_ID=464988 /ORGANISM="Hemiselmis andersenii, Strain CCMP1180" /LENGTH=97 /DNA_ID=CAMNT_0009577165 /DNA_START=355 /DNA_END=645 /DNA_ORIENTATION=-
MPLLPATTFLLDLGPPRPVPEQSSAAHKSVTLPLSALSPSLWGSIHEKMGSKGLVNQSMVETHRQGQQGPFCQPPPIFESPNLSSAPTNTLSQTQRT